MSANHNIADLNKALQAYVDLSGKTVHDVLLKQGSKLVREMKAQLGDAIKPKGAIREEALARLKGGKGIRIRPGLREKVEGIRAAKGLTKTGKKRRFKLNIQQEVVRREIAARERGRGVMRATVRYPMGSVEKAKALSRYGFLLSHVGLKVENEGGIFRITWPEYERTKDIVKGLRNARPAQAIRRAIDDVREDILVYVRRKQSELANKAVRQMIKH